MAAPGSSSLTYGELHLGRPLSRGGESPRGIEGLLASPPGRSSERLPQHLAFLKRTKEMERREAREGGQWGGGFQYVDVENGGVREGRDVR